VRTYRVALAASSRAALPARAPLPLPDKPSLAVLPFQNVTGDAEQEYFVDGMVEEITTAIARLPRLFVIARNSAFTYKGKPVDVKQVAQQLGVRYVLEGSVRKAGNRVRITGQLIDTATGANIWADRALHDQPRMVPAMRVKAAANAHLGRLDAARAELSRMLAIDSKQTIAGFREFAHFAAPEVLELYAVGLRLAGLPEE